LLLTQSKAPEALTEAQQAEALAPDSASVNATMGKALDANGRAEEALPYYQKALSEALAAQPDFQQPLIKTLQRRLSTNQP
jgi:predicted Zn-dependent protease